MYVKYNLDRDRNNNSKNIKSYLFIDDIKIYAELDQKQNQLVEAVTEFFRDIGMEFRLDKSS